MRVACNTRPALSRRVTRANMIETAHRSPTRTCTARAARARPRIRCRSCADPSARSVSQTRRVHRSADRKAVASPMQHSANRAPRHNAYRICSVRPISSARHPLPSAKRAPRRLKSRALRRPSVMLRPPSACSQVVSVHRAIGTGSTAASASPGLRAASSPTHACRGVRTALRVPTTRAAFRTIAIRLVGARRDLAEPKWRYPPVHQSKHAVNGG
jgi:hypothetical protein